MIRKIFELEVDLEKRKIALAKCEDFNLINAFRLMQAPAEDELSAQDLMHHVTQVLQIPNVIP
jgi:hypothetical protein